MASIANLAVSLSANTAAFTEGMNKAAKSTRQFKQGFSGVDLQLIKGGGAAAGITYAFRRLGAAADDLSPIVDRFIAGQLTAGEAIGEATDALAKQVPVFGAAYDAGTKYGEMLGKLIENAYLNTDAQTKALASFAKTQAAINSVGGKASSSLEAMNRELMLINEPTQEGKATLSARFKFDEAMEKAAALRAELDKIAKTKAFAEQRTAIEGQIADIEAGAAAMLEAQQRLIKEQKEAPVSQSIQDLVQQVEEFGVPAFDKMRKQVLDTFGPEAAAFVDQYKQKLDELQAKAETEGIIKSITEEFKTLDMSEIDKLAMRLKELGASDEQIQQAVEMKTKINDITRAREEQKQAEEQLAKEAQQVYESTRTELEKHEEELDRLSDLLDKGAIDWDTYARAVKKVNVEFNKLSKLELPGAQTIQFGSIAGNPSLGGGASSVTSKIEKNTKDSLKLQERTAKATEKIAAQSKGVGVVVLGAEALQ